MHMANALRIPSMLRGLGNLVTIPTGRQRIVKDNVHAFPARDKDWGQRYRIKMRVSFEKLWEDTWIHHAKDNHYTFRLEAPLRARAVEEGALVFVSALASFSEGLHRSFLSSLAEWKRSSTTLLRAGATR
jgi:hypothetical protein